MTRRSVRFGLLLLGLAALPAQAQAGCVWPDLVRDDARVAAVRPGAARVHFVTGAALKAGCPQDGARRCQSPAYVVPGDVVLIGHAEGRLTCAGFVGSRDEVTIDFLPTASLVVQSSTPPALSDWTGHWTAPEQDITIRAVAGGALSVEGDATWGMGDPQRREIGGVHTGEVHGTAAPVGGVLAFTQGEERTLRYDAGDEYDCRIRMIRRGPFLIVRDNTNCGGMNVSFSGFYRRRAR